MKLYLASGNPHKVGEFQALASASLPDLEILSARAAGGMPAVEEDTGTFTGNARKKARALKQLLPDEMWVLADDSGLCVDALAGAPGVESAYFAGPAGNAAANLEKLIEVMRTVPVGRREARFVCVLVLLGPDGGEQVFEGRCPGQLRVKPAGNAGFGYDPVFTPDGYTESYAALGEGIKNQISHRARAFAALARWLRADQLGCSGSAAALRPSELWPRGPF
jgi:XTP/dITP diphosphohydrolase